MSEANKPEKLGFVRLYNATVPIANVFVQDPNKLPRLGEIEHNTHMMFVAHYCWEAGLLLVASHVVDAPLGWLEDDDLRPRMTSYHCGTETSAVDRIVGMKREEWSKRCADVELAVYQHKPLRVVRYDADGVIQEDPKPELEPDKAEESSVTISVDGQRAVPMTDKQFRDLPGKIRKLANDRQASAAKGGR